MASAVVWQILQLFCGEAHSGELKARVEVLSAARRALALMSYRRRQWGKAVGCNEYSRTSVAAHAIYADGDVLSRRILA